MSAEKKDCVVCGCTVDWDYITEINEDDHGELLMQVDQLGVDSLTEQEQVLYEGLVCSWKCYDKLK